MDYRDLPYDAEIEYLGLDRNQRYSIVTNISQARGVGFGCELSHFVAALPKASTNYPYLIGFNKPSPNRAQFYIKGSNTSVSLATGTINLDWQSSYHGLGIVISGNNKQKLEIKSYSSSKMRVYLDDTYKYEYNKFVPSSAGVLSLLSASQIYEGRIYHLFAYDENNDYLLDAIPVRVGDVGYMYDKVSGQLFGNSGTGSFVLGPDVAPGRYANEVAFLESWGNQYIDTGIKPSTDTKIELKCLYCKSGAGLTNYGALIGADDRDTAYILNHSAVANFTYGLEFSNNFANPQTRLLTFDSTASPQNMRVYDEGGSLVTTLTCIRGVFEVNQNLYLFAINRNGTPVYGSNRILYCKIYDGDTLVRDYVPVEYNGIGYMYDKVSGLFFDNQGTGKFLFGSIAKACARSYTRRQLMMEIGRPYDAKIEYLEGDGHAYIDLHLNVDMNDVVEGNTVKRLGITRSVSLWGCCTSASANCFHSYVSNASMGITQRQIAISKNANEEEVFYVSRQLIRVQNITTGNTTQLTTVVSGDYTIPITFMLFKSNVYPPLNGLRIKWFKIHNKADLIPVRVGNVGYMYDKISGKLFGNAGTGSFILGPDK